MARKPEGVRPLTQAERQARQRVRKTSERIRYRSALHLISLAKSIREARKIAMEALSMKEDESDV